MVLLDAFDEVELNLDSGGVNGVRVAKSAG
jgi:hypothetical protein